jgi:hypothetical protein
VYAVIIGLAAIAAALWVVWMSGTGSATAAPVNAIEGDDAWGFSPEEWERLTAVYLAGAARSSARMRGVTARSASSNNIAGMS